MEMRRKRISVLSVALLVVFATTLARADAESKTVAVLGGGVGGLTAAHELIDRGYRVQVYENLDQFGGKARSFGALGSGKSGRGNLPAEHGFRIFAGEYGATRDTMRRIPFGNQTVEDNIVMGTEAFFASRNSTTFLVPSTFPRNIEQLHLFYQYFKTVTNYLPHSEAAFFAKRLYILATSCMERRYSEFEHVSWWEYMFADDLSPQYRDLVKLISGNILAANPHLASAHTVGAMALDMLFRTLVPGQKGILYMLNGPTSKQWIDPWVDLLRSKGVEFYPRHRLVGIEVDEDTRRVNGATVRRLSDNTDINVQADYYVAAIPVEKMQPLVTTAMKASSPSMAKIGGLEVAWMNGIQMYLKRDIPVVNGNIGFIKSPWALAAVSQTQFRPSLNLTALGDGSVRGVFSMTISNWTTPGLFSCPRPAHQCSRDEIAAEVWDQVLAWLPDYFNKDDLDSWYLDPAITWEKDGSQENYSPLFINTAGSIDMRPYPVIEIENMFIGSDYARTPQNVACMETANEASRIAVNKILDLDGRSDVPKCKLYPWEKDGTGEGFLKLILTPLRDYDRHRFNKGEPHLHCKCPACMCAGPKHAEQDESASWRELLGDEVYEFVSLIEKRLMDRFQRER